MNDRFWKNAIIILSFLTAVTAISGCGYGGSSVDLKNYPARSVMLDGKEFSYRVYVPKFDDNSAKLPVLLYLHGAGNRGSDNASQLNGLDGYIQANKEKIKFIMVIPQLPEGRFWDAEALQMANAALDETVKEFNADADRISVMGFSLGGHGVWSMAVMYPGKFAALVPMSARVMPTEQEMPKVAKEVAVAANDPNNFNAYAEKVGQTAVWIFHGLDDDIVPDDQANAIQDAMRSGGNKKAEMTSVVRGGHSPLGLEKAELYEWLAQQKR